MVSIQQASSRGFKLSQCIISMIRGRSLDQITKAIVIGAFLIMVLSFSAVRIASFDANHKILMKAPMNFEERPGGCPAVKHHTDLDHWWNSKICVTTLTDAAKADMWQRMVRWRNFDNLLEMTWENKHDYAEKHKYDLFDESKSLDTSRPPSWSKIKAAKRLMTEENCDWVFWMDADTVIMNSDIRLESFLPTDEGVDFLIAPEKNDKINAGVWIIRNTPWALNFLDTWWGMDSYVKPKGLGISGDNDALNAFRKSQTPEYIAEHFSIVPRCTFNSVAKWITPEEDEERKRTKAQHKEFGSEFVYHKGDFVAHVAGVSNKITTSQQLLEDAT